MFVCGPDGVAPPLGPALALVPINDITVDTDHRIHVIQLNAHDAPSLLFDPTDVVEIVIAAANQNTHHNTFTTSSTSRTVGLSSALIAYRIMKTRQITIDVTPVKIYTTPHI